ncbi:CDP-alcohol phosphatidyltransferase family protein [Candidatus Kapabacteria bacterium]|nr:CDP-alcohol phosphatidyltransferase family protein [Candidatus Kapabacteria bacterium]
MNISNLLSLTRLFIAIPLSFAIWNNEQLHIFIYVLIAAITDFLDGFFARRFNQITELGKILDPIADKTLIIITGIVLMIKEEIPIWFGIAIILRDLIILSAGIFVKNKYKVVLSANLFGKITLNVIVVTILLSVFYKLQYQFYVYCIATLFMFASLMSYLFNAIKKTGEVT